MTKTLASPIDLARHLRGIDFPVQKEDLIQHARDNNADEAVLREMEAMPEQEFRSMKDVTRAMGHAEDEQDEEQAGVRQDRTRSGR